MKRTATILVCILLAFQLYAQQMDPRPIEDEEIITHKAYRLSFNCEHKQPSWVSYTLTKEHAEAKLPRKDSFRADPAVSCGSATLADYKNSGLSRGHLAPNADMRWNVEVQSECFYLSNMSPQYQLFNGGVWARMEEQVRLWAIEYDSIYVVTGPALPLGIEKTIGKDNEVSVPFYFYKAIYAPTQREGIAFLIKGLSDQKGPLTKWVISIDQLEDLVGIDFFYNLDDGTEDAIESVSNPDKWVWNAK